MIQVLAKDITVGTDSANGLLAYAPYALGVAFFMVVGYFIWKLLPKPLLGLLFAVMVILFWAYHGGHL